MGKIVINDGSEKFDIYNKQDQLLGSFVINPADTGLVDRYKKVEEKLKGIEFNAEGDTDEQVKANGKIIIDAFTELFGEDAGSTLFRITGPFTPLENGKPYFMEVFGVVTKLVADTTTARFKKTAKYLKGLN